MDSKNVTKSNDFIDSSDQHNNTLKEIHSEVKDVAYVYSEEYVTLCNSLPKVINRASMVHSLIEAYGLYSKMSVIKPRPANEEEIMLFHSKEYVDCLKSLSETDDEEKYTEEAEEYGLTYDCPAYPGVYDYASYVSGASVKAAHCLMAGACKVAINWMGGWHHAKRDTASGFCYLNDIVISILTLRKKFDRVLYIDLDVHHGDGVEDAFCATNKVFTLSFHKYSPGFFPGSGNIRDIGMGKGKHYTFNVPFMDGITDEQYLTAFNNIAARIQAVFKPQAIVCQCGADCLAGDPLGKYNLTPKGMAQCVETLQSMNLPLLLLGGGGYNLANTARCWTYITSRVLKLEISSDIPEHDYFEEYGPDFDLEVTPSNIQNKNKEGFLERIYQLLEENLENVKV